MQISHWYFLSKEIGVRESPRQTFSEDRFLNDVNESDAFTADCPTVVRWREVTLDDRDQVKEGPSEGWGVPYRIAREKDLGDPDERHEAAPGFGRRRVQPDGRYAIQVEVVPINPADGRPLQFTFRPSEKHLNEEEVESMVDEIGGADYFLDHSTLGKGTKLSPKEAEVLDITSRGSQGHTRFHQAELLSREWINLKHLQVEAMRTLPTRPTKLRGLDRPRPGSQDLASLRRNFAEGRLDPRPGRIGQPLRNRVHNVVPMRDRDTPAAAELIRTTRRLNALRTLNIADLSAISLQLDIMIRQRQAQGQNNRRHLKELRALENQQATVEKVLGRLKALQPLPVPADLAGLKSRSSRQTSAARFDRPHRAWLAKYDNIASRCDLTAGLHRRLRLRGSARRRTWQLYEYWVAWKFYDYLTRQLKFWPAAGQGWHSLEAVEGDQELVYGLRKRGSLTLHHGSPADPASCLTVTLQVEPELPRPGLDPFTPDLMLTLGGNLRDPPHLPPDKRVRVIPLIIDAKFRALTGENAPEVLKSSGEKYQDLLEPQLGRRPMAFLAHPGHIKARSNSQRFHAWPARKQPGDVAAGLKPKHLPYQNGVLLLRPPHKGAPAAQNLYGDSDLHRVITAWLLQNRISWICLECGADLGQVPKADLQSMAVRAMEKRDEDPDKGRWRYLEGSNGTYRIAQPLNMHVVCPHCENVVIISHCSETNCRDSSGYKTLIAKQFGSLEDQTAKLDEHARASWAHEEITVQGNRPGNEALWDRPCPSCSILMPD